MPHKAVFIASTGQHVGKTTTSLGLVSGLKKRFSEIGFLKPVGQQHIELSCCTRVDKDVVLFKEHFNLSCDYKDMSPVLIPKGLTRDFLNDKVDISELKTNIQSSFSAITKHYPFTVIEGTGHAGVGSIINLNNAQVAALLGTPIILVAPGGLGSSFDELTLNKTLCDAYNVKVLGVIFNRVHDDKREMILSHMEKALSRWDVPILGSIPYSDFLTTLTMQDFESLFESPLLSGEPYRYRHYSQVKLISCSSEKFKSMIKKNQLFITHSSREDIILTVLSKFWDSKIYSSKEDLACGLILTGETPPKKSIIERIKQADIPMVYVPLDSYEVMKKISSFTAKFRVEDKEKLQKGISLVESHIDFEKLLNIL